ncbi:hypothetical protein BG015_009562 [Linnemannia schmuckeri]|uniref:Uncharacterized protein n=1 Tax=Linnemannia schmuckeri TaxID=64567 RepID=A0A9P5RYT9_9FUNG|nr:hypothetical protein BG015_009562 [Linnemannia schmuckeri]
MHIHPLHIEILVRIGLFLPLWVPVQDANPPFDPTRIELQTLHACTSVSRILLSQHTVVVNSVNFRIIQVFVDDPTPFQCVDLVEQTIRWNPRRELHMKGTMPSQVTGTGTGTGDNEELVLSPPQQLVKMNLNLKLQEWHDALPATTLDAEDFGGFHRIEVLKFINWYYSPGQVLAC